MARKRVNREKKQSFDRRSAKKGYQPPKKIEDHWSIHKKTLYVESRQRQIPSWLLPLAILLLIMLVVFWLAPNLITRVQAALHWGVSNEEEPKALLYGEDTWTVNKPTADIFFTDDLKSDRKSQALYNEPVLLLSKKCNYGFVKVRLDDGCEGYMFKDDLVDGRYSIEPDNFRYKLIIAETTKRILSHASQGTLLVEVPMGTVLFADYHGNGVSRVVLPTADLGWISDDGVIIIDPFTDIEPPDIDTGARYFSTTALAFNQITYLPGGQSIAGVSPAGIARLAGAINGIRLPRLLTDLAESGRQVEIMINEETGLIATGSIKAGDLVFFGKSDWSLLTMGVCIATDQLLYAEPGYTAVKLLDLSVNKELQQKILFIRRLY